MNRNPQLFRCTKILRGFPCTHRQWRASSHCRFVHGYDRTVVLNFACSELDENGWVMDFGGLSRIKRWLNDLFDHTFLAAEDDPHLDKWKNLDELGLIQLRVLPNPGIEGSADYIFSHVTAILAEVTQERVWLESVEVRENEKNSATRIRV